MPKVINRAIHLRMFVGFCLTIFSALPQILGLHRQFSSPNSRNEEMMGDGFLWCYCRFVLNSKQSVGVINPVISRGQLVASSIFFYGVILDAFCSSQNRMCRKLNKP